MEKSKECRSSFPNFPGKLRIFNEFSQLLNIQENSGKSSDPKKTSQIKSGKSDTPQTQLTRNKENRESAARFSSQIRKTLKNFPNIFWFRMIKKSFTFGLHFAHFYTQL